jgi:hypothetical protein
MMKWYDESAFDEDQPTVEHDRPGRAALLLSCEKTMKHFRERWHSDISLAGGISPPLLMSKGHRRQAGGFRTFILSLL